jgi:uncharacterized protein YdeI (YjbR/CyaY-like superfamily)
MKANNSYLPAVDAYINHAAPFARPVLEHVREMIHKSVPDVEEAMKWSMPFFMLNGIILGNMAGFKEHCSVTVWNRNVVQTRSESAEKRREGMGDFGKVRSKKDLPDDRTLKAMMKEAAEKIRSGERAKNWTRKPTKTVAETEVPEALAAALKKNKTATKQFAAMSPSCRREYCQWIQEAKREETRTGRVATAVGWIAEGKRRNWKYETC